MTHKWLTTVLSGLTVLIGLGVLYLVLTSAMLTTSERIALGFATLVMIVNGGVCLWETLKGKTRK